MSCTRYVATVIALYLPLAACGIDAPEDSIDESALEDPFDEESAFADPIDESELEDSIDESVVTSDKPDDPTVSREPIPNPGVIQLDDGKWIVLGTGSPDAFPGRIWVTSNELSDNYHHVRKRLLKKRANWMSKSKGPEGAVWAPSVTRADDGHYVVFFAAAVAGQNGHRCIGAGRTEGTTLDPHAITTRYLFVVEPTPLVCWNGTWGESKPADNVDNANNPPREKPYSIIDATPSWVTPPNATNKGLFLTYKTQHKLKNGTFHTTLRMVRLDPTHPEKKTDGTSNRLTQMTGPSIEENPVLVERPGGGYTLFSSEGLYGNNCTASGPHPYRTFYRNSASLWDWPDRGTKLTFPARFNSCGSGNAQVVKNLAGEWRIFFNGKWRKKWGNPKTRNQFRKIHFYLYVGVPDVDHGEWKVKSVSH